MYVSVCAHWLSSVSRTPISCLKCNHRVLLSPLNSRVLSRRIDVYRFQKQIVEFRSVSDGSRDYINLDDICVIKSSKLVLSLPDSLNDFTFDFQVGNIFCLLIVVTVAKLLEPVKFRQVKSRCNVTSASNIQMNFHIRYFVFYQVNIVL